MVPKSKFKQLAKDKHFLLLLQMVVDYFRMDSLNCREEPNILKAWYVSHMQPLLLLVVYVHIRKHYL